MALRGDGTPSQILVQSQAGPPNIRPPHQLAASSFQEKMLSGSQACFVWTSAHVPSRTWRDIRLESAKHCKADMDQAALTNLELLIWSLMKG
jgi:hypothetical protein